jgi:hypothetical protein
MMGALPQAALSDVKLSNSGICHDTGSPWYKRTKNFIVFETMSECLSRGRAYSGYDSSPAPSLAVSAPVTSIGGASVAIPYDRGLYGSWIDKDGDCQNQRHELLIALSTGPIRYSGDGCRAVHGRWNDPYTGRIFTDSSDMDVDHIVPLAWAHVNGADRWDSEKRRTFANDPVNLMAVDARENRSKGARGPTDWMPQLVIRRFYFGILARRSALNLCGIYSILKKTGCGRYQWSGGPCINASEIGNHER